MLPQQHKDPRGCHKGFFSLYMENCFHTLFWFSVNVYFTGSLQLIRCTILVPKLPLSLLLSYLNNPESWHRWKFWLSVLRWQKGLFCTLLLGVSLLAFCNFKCYEAISREHCPFFRKLCPLSSLTLKWNWLHLWFVGAHLTETKQNSDHDCVFVVLRI